MEQSVCPNCGANMEGLVQHCDCCGAVLDRKKAFLFFSAVAWRSAAAVIMELLHPVETVFAQRYGKTSFSEALDQIGILPLCFPEEMHREPDIAKERRYVTLKKRYADLRLHISYEKLIAGNQEERLLLCAENIASAATYIRKKDRSFREKAFLNAVFDCFYEIYGIRV